MVFSATTVALSMAVLVLFPMHFLKSFAYAGVATVAFAAVAAIVVTPAALVLVGDRLDVARRPQVRAPGVRPARAGTGPRRAEVLVSHGQARHAPTRIPIGLTGVAFCCAWCSRSSA